LKECLFQILVVVANSKNVSPDKKKRRKVEKQIEIYKTQDGTEVTVKLGNDTVWLDAHTIASIQSGRTGRNVNLFQNGTGCF
jgi:hypothetical protein